MGRTWDRIYRLLMRRRKPGQSRAYPSRPYYHANWSACHSTYTRCGPESMLELPPIGWLLFILGSSQSDSTALPSFLDTYATRLLAEPLSRRVGKLLRKSRPRSELYSLVIDPHFNTLRTLIPDELRSHLIGLTGAVSYPTDRPHTV